jgi:hypothetical protein
MWFRTLLVTFVLCFSSALLAQTQAAAPPQTARQALIEMITGGQKAAMKHLTVEMQKYIKDSKNASAMGSLSAFDQIKSGSTDFQTFDTGNILFSASEPKGEKIEVHIESDDLSGDSDTIELSLHQFKDGIEKDIPYVMLVSQFSIGMIRQENIWRLNDISFGVKVPLGDPKLIDKFAKSVEGERAETTSDAKNNESKPMDIPVQSVISFVAFAEANFARMHPETGFTCNLADLAENNGMNLDPAIFNGQAYKEYKFGLSGCQGKPAETFHLTAEPMIPAAGVKAFCTDATHNVRSSDDGRGASCLSSGKVSHQEHTSVGLVGGVVK